MEVTLNGRNAFVAGGSRGIGRFGMPEDVAKVPLFLASHLAGWVTGQTIAVDGGHLPT